MAVMRMASGEIALLTLVLRLVIVFDVVFTATQSSAVTGTVSLDRFTFDKILRKFDAVLVKFDSSYPYGDKHDQFQKFAKATVDTEDFIAAEVHIQDYGDRENADLAERFSVPSDNKDKFPFIKLFIKGQDKPIDFDDTDFSADYLKKFVRKNSNIYFGLEGCLESFDKLAKSFMIASDEAKTKILSEAEELKTSLKKQSSANIYIKLMERVIERGNGFIKSEKSRIQNIIKGKITDQKRQELQVRLNILDSFMTENDNKDEL